MAQRVKTHILICIIPVEFLVWPLASFHIGQNSAVAPPVNCSKTSCGYERLSWTQRAPGLHYIRNFTLDIVLIIYGTSVAVNQRPVGKVLRAGLLRRVTECCNNGLYHLNCSPHVDAVL